MGLENWHQPLSTRHQRIITGFQRLTHKVKYSWGWEIVFSRLPEKHPSPSQNKIFSRNVLVFFTTDLELWNIGIGLSFWFHYLNFRWFWLSKLKWERGWSLSWGWESVPHSLCPVSIETTYRFITVFLRKQVCLKAIIAFPFSIIRLSAEGNVKESLVIGTAVDFFICS